MYPDLSVTHAPFGTNSEKGFLFALRFFLASSIESYQPAADGQLLKQIALLDLTNVNRPHYGSYWAVSRFLRGIVQLNC